MNELQNDPIEMFRTINVLLKEIQKNPNPQLIEATANLVLAYKEVTR
ncbi:hypothetical protein K4S53_07075 [Staphylococcus epidermidis]|uniref:Uncharacterized protein n=2 Tax=root TaxID=1 RepID=A0A8X8K780_STAEP|nr:MULTISPECIES: hypothetical protein [Staphylococcus]ASN69739.1 hypothetical protein 10AX1_31 [uncultured Caudovirales phage]ASN70577.1 hypothetical protein 10F7_10 [uncultured Caudovirales phage]EHQ76063.1 hypothetical protein SEVCU065_1859 [Staphylococcus epidermidis VCU065]EJE30597.1 hypothetical protein HMPREF9972_08315 [Staphylococcus epidermidis NIH04008]EJE35769.1 hypothetical protein HMPREF9973_03105 [Staphylococcus epidermidis NIH05001]